MLLVGISVSALAYLLFAFACSETAMAWTSSRETIGLLFLSRLVQGAGGATTGVVQAYVGDAIVPEERAKALGWITAATSAGVMLGPAIGSLAATLGPAAPGLAATVLCLANLVFAWRWLPESSTHEVRERARGTRRSLRGDMLAVALHPGRPVARLIWIYAIGMMAFMAMNGILALFLERRFQITEHTIGYLYTYVGTVSLVMRSLILGPAVRRMGEVGAMRLGLGSMVAGFALQTVAPTVASFYAAITLIPIGTALLFPATTSLVSRFAERHEIGATMGVQQAYGGVARLLGPIGAGAAFQYLGVGSPFWISAALAAATFVFALGLEPPPKPRTLEAPAPGEPTPAPVPASRS
jgi:predicted MFS family arabinose efflux permease